MFTSKLQKLQISDTSAELKKSAEKEMTYILYPIKNWEKKVQEDYPLVIKIANVVRKQS